VFAPHRRRPGYSGLGTDPPRAVRTAPQDLGVHALTLAHALTLSTAISDGQGLTGELALD
jgi:hypothetical protein